ncbi:putative cytoplasmic protein [Thermotoga petrophila RKU-10]|uniref:Putative cytoplasmic protein n=1 Tax=Thermotoga petrophila (strain ATCC BAA-489 / DSM 13996 / JCM 10882 / RKU-10) TaxID=590168 RepID=D2C524_THEP2|nr:ATP-binding protein [Thermotoga petrophila]ADA67828.1 putative cytoplasmic protein [Thermotoga petrophila RKU-10]
MSEESPIIGLSSATSNQPNSSDEFFFWLAPGVIVNPFDIVEAEQIAPQGSSRTFGIVTTLEHSTDAPTHLSNFISNDFGQVSTNPNTVRQGTTVARVAVLSNDKNIYMPVMNDRPVRFADEAAIHTALGIDQVPEQYRVPAGLIEMSNGTTAVVYLDSRYLLGPEGAHMNITGISGLATKTSYAIFLIQSILQTVENRDRIGVIILNVKHGDLLTIDQPPKEELPHEQREMWKRLGLTPQPFSNVRYLLPYGKDTPVTGRPNSFRIPQRNWFLYAYSLQDTYDKLDLLFSNIPDPWDTVGALIGEIHQGLSDPKTGLWGPSGHWRNVTDWDSLLNGPPLVDQQGRAQSVGDVKAISVARFRRLLRRIVKTRQTGIFVQQRPRGVKSLSSEIAKIRGGETIVVDIARLADEEQTLVFGDILRTIYALYAEEGSEREDLPEKVIIFVDELNKYAPAREKESPIIEQILDIAERGRSLGVILFGAEQFMSAVHDRVVGNCSTLIIGRSSSAELSSPVYRFLDPAVKANITRLQKGELVISHPIFRQPLKLKFPKPAYLQEGTG